MREDCTGGKMSQHSIELKIFAGNSNPPLAAEISQYLKLPLGKAIVESFSDGESKVEIKENVRGADIFVVQSISAPGNDNRSEERRVGKECRSRWSTNH